MTDQLRDTLNRAARELHRLAHRPSEFDQCDVFICSDARAALRSGAEVAAAPEPWKCDWQPDDLNPGPECPYCAGDMCGRFDGLGGCRHDKIERHGYAARLTAKPSEPDWDDERRKFREDTGL